MVARVSPHFAIGALPVAVEHSTVACTSCLRFTWMLQEALYRAMSLSQANTVGTCGRRFGCWPCTRHPRAPFQWQPTRLRWFERFFALSSVVSPPCP